MENQESNIRTFAQRLKHLRMQKGLSQKAFAKSIDLNYTQYNRYEKGDTLPSTESLSKLADALKVSVDYLLDGIEEDAAIANFEDKELLKLFSELEKLPNEKKKAVKIVLEAIVKEEKIKQLAS